MSTAIGIVWALVSLLVAGACTFSFLQPAWFVRPSTGDALGPYTCCVQTAKPQHSPRLRRVCAVYGGYFSFHFASGVPSRVWQAACALYGVGCSFACLAATLALLTLCLPKRFTDRRLTTATGYTQVLAAVTLVAGLVTFPFGLDSQFAAYHCADCAAYDAGSCRIGWAYVLAIVAGCVSFFCPFLSRFTTMTLAKAPPVATTRIIITSH